MMGAPVSFSFLGVDLQLAHPERWPWILAAVLALLVAAWGISKREKALRLLTSSSQLRETIVPHASHWRGIIRGVFSILGLALLSAALLRPQTGEREVMVQRKGIDLVVAVDASRSMTARDVLPSRLERAKLELSTLIDRLHGDRVGLVVFAGEAFVQCPLTYDYAAAKLFLRAIDPGAMPSQGTAIARGLETAGGMLSSVDDGSKTQVVLLLSDGEDHSGKVDAATQALVERGVRVYALGIGSESGTPIPILDSAGRVQGYQKNKTGGTVISRLDDGQLRRIAKETNGLYVSAAGGDIGMGEILAELSRLEKTEREGRLAMEWEEAYHYFAFPGLLLLALGAAVPEGRRRR